jgi:hypothetical protein
LPEEERTYENILLKAKSFGLQEFPDTLNNNEKQEVFFAVARHFKKKIALFIADPHLAYATLDVRDCSYFELISCVSLYVFLFYEEDCDLITQDISVKNSLNFEGERYCLFYGVPKK